MTPAARALRVAIVASAGLCACTAAPVTVDSPKSVRGRELPPYESVEECLRLYPGDRVEYAFESTAPVDFNFHFHEGRTVVMPVVRESSRADAGVFIPPVAQDYCLMWEAGPAGAVLDFRIRLRRAGN